MIYSKNALISIVIAVLGAAVSQQANAYNKNFGANIHRPVQIMVWHYRDFTDDTTQKPVHEAVKLSDNDLIISDQIQKGKIIISRSTATIVEFTIPVHKLICPMPSCDLSIRFDDGPIEDYKATIGRVYNYRITLQPTERFIQQLKASSKLTMTADIDGVGPTDFTFTTSNFEWPTEGN